MISSIDLFFSRDWAGGGGPAVDVPRFVVEVGAASAVEAVGPWFGGCVGILELVGVVVAPNMVGLDADADDMDVEGPLVALVKGLIALSGALSAGLLRIANSPPEAAAAEDDVAELVAAPPRFPNRPGPVPLVGVAVLVSESCAEVAGVAEGRLNAGFDEV